MKRQILKKSLFFSILSLIISYPIQAQMIDLIGSMAVGGAQNVGAVHSVGNMNRTLQNVLFFEQLQEKNAEISTTYFGNYQNMKIQTININGVKVVFQPVNEGKNYQAFISPITNRLCRSLIQSSFDNLVSLRFIVQGFSTDYTLQQARSNPQICTTTDALSLVFE